jgi:beta-lactamase family protein
MIHGVGTSKPGFPKHFDGKHFYNPEATQARGLLDVLRWKLSSRLEPSPGFISDVEQSVPPRQLQGSGLRATLVNCATVLLQPRGSNILTDPIWSERTSPVAWAGPRRRRKPGVSWANLPRIDTVLISHNHYDQLDLPTLRRLAARGGSTFVAPVGVGRLLRSENIGPAHALDWGESLPLPGFTVHCVPALHSSSRRILGWNRTLWCGYVIESQERLRVLCGRHCVRTPFRPDSERRVSHYCPSEPTNHAGSCPRCIWLSMRRSERMKSWAAGPASRSTMGLSNCRMRASTPISRRF